MPIYEYRCTKCKETFEVMQKVSEGNRGLQCPKCGTEEPERLLSAFCSSSSKSTAGTTASAHSHSSSGHS